VYYGVVIILLRRREVRKGERRDQIWRRLRKRGPHTLTRAPMTPREVRRRYSKGRVFEVVFKKGYKKRGICAFFNSVSRRQYHMDAEIETSTV
jgi:hypothetical protein